MKKDIRSLHPTLKQSALFITALTIVVIFSHLIFNDLFPGPKGLGHDYSYFFPHLLANYFAIRTEGWLNPAWFTPAFCGGQPAFADPQSIFYSLPQLLVTFLDPVQSVYATLLIFTGMGFAGAYFFLRLSLGCSTVASLIGATVFALNGFFSHRILIGHLAFHGIMLIPWLAWALTMPIKRPSHSTGGSLLLGAVGASILAYWILSGMVVLLIPALLAVAALILIYGIYGHPFRHLALRIALCLVLGLGLSASKLSGMLAYITEVPRAYYPLPGMSDLASTIGIAVRALFLSPENIATTAAAGLTNAQFRLDRHEFEFSVSLVPLVLIVIGLLVRLKQGTYSAHAFTVKIWQYALGAGLLLLMLLPVAVNTFAPAWNDFLKSLPIIGSSSNLFRWFFIFVPVLAVASAIAFDRAFPSGHSRYLAGAIAISTIFLTHAQIDRSYYSSQSYDPKPVAKAFSAARKPDIAPKVQYIGANLNSRGQIMSRGSNDLIVMNVSQMRCYNPMFGYLLEAFPMETLHPGDPLEVTDGHLNLKDPACYVFPKENNCKPGDHFSEKRIDDAKSLLHYRSYPFSRSGRQKTADLISLLAIIALPVIIVASVISLRRKR